MARTNPSPVYNSRRMCQGSTLLHGSQSLVPAVITSDREAKFICSIWNSLYRFLGIIHFPTTSFHHQSNGLAERFYCRLKMSLKALLSGADWFHYLSLVLVGLHSVPREDSTMFAFEAIFGSPLVHN